MTDVVAKKANEVYLQLICSEAISAELSDFFTFFAPNYQYSPLYKKKVWDGKIRLYNKRTKYLYTGLTKYLKKFCEERKYSLDLDAEMFNDFSLDNAKAYADSLNIQSRGNPIEVRDYQLEAFTRAIRNKRMLMLSPTASGKSLIIYLMMRYLLENHCVRGLLIVPTVSLVEQMYGDFKDYSTANKWNVDDYCQRIYQGKDKAVRKPLVVSTWQSVYELDKKYFEQFDFIIGDEAHTFKAKSLASIMTKLTRAEYRIGTTGTIEDTEVHKLTLEAYFGNVSKIISTKELIDRKQLADFEIKCLVLKYPETLCKQAKTLDYHQEMDLIVSNPARNNFITNLTLSLEGNSLVLFQFVEKHGKILHDLIQKKSHKERKVFLVFGETEAEDREKVRAIAEKEKDAIIVASFGTFSTGVNIRNLHNIVFASPSKSKIRNLQSIGRGLRLGEAKDKATLYDIADDLRSDNYVNYTMKHYAERVKTYHEEKFKVSTHKVELKNA